MYRLWMTAAAVAAYFLLGHLGLTAILAYVWITAMAAGNTAKTRSTEQRVNDLVNASGTTNGRVSNLSGHNTTTNGLSDGTINGHTDSAGLSDGTISGTSGPQNGGAAAHTHGPGSYAVTSGQHQHGANATNGNLAVANGQHNHTLPSV